MYRLTSTEGKLCFNSCELCFSIVKKIQATYLWTKH